MPVNWVVWLALQQGCLAALCWVAYAWPRSWTNAVIWRSAGLWFLTQAADELWGGNFFSTGHVEYLFLALLVVGVFLYIRHHDTEKGQGKGAGGYGP